MQDLENLKVEEITPLTREIIARQATQNIGTIGHVAHGKSTLVLAISGTNVSLSIIFYVLTHLCVNRLSSTEKKESVILLSSWDTPTPSFTDALSAQHHLATNLTSQTRKTQPNANTAVLSFI